ncbi:MAG: murein biosynthesis integral membrane protein MurJ [Bdellovibrionota bacterium]
MAIQSNEEKGSVVLSAGVAAFGILVSRILGMVRDMAIAKFVDTNSRDAFLSAFRLANVFRRLFGEGGLGVGFIPILTEILAGRTSANLEESDKRAKEFVSAVFSMLVTVLLVLSLLAFLFMDRIIGFLLSGDGFDSVPGKLELTVQFARYMIAFPVLACLYALFMAILHSFRRFLVAAIAPAIFNVVMIVAARSFLWTTEKQVLLLSLAVVVGGFLQMALLVPSLVRLGFFPRVSFRWNTKDVGRFLATLGPTLFAASIFQLSILVNLRFASELPAGSQSHLYLAERILELPISLFVISFSQALLPTLAAIGARRETARMTEAMNHAIRLALFVAIPAALGMLVLAWPIVETLFLGREFKFLDALQTAQLIRIYSVTVLAAAGTRILAQGFYAVGNMWYPALAGAVSLVSHVIFAFVLTKEWGLNGLAAASVGSGTVNMLMLARGHVKFVAPIDVRRLAKSFAVFAVCGGAMVAVIMWYDPVRRLVGANSTLAKSLFLGLAVTAGIGVYMGVAHLLRVPEYHETLQTVRERLKKKRS